MHILETKVENEVEIFCKKPCQQIKSMKTNAVQFLCYLPLTERDLMCLNSCYTDIGCQVTG
jgi:hypothetical protein